ncbi:Lysine--tRNA ligase, partial [ANME-1 cluster archaeon GoMg2]|nr:Lysine--tRNA ligase [ANME-1 cluster archaeon GoMg2]
MMIPYVSTANNIIRNEKIADIFKIRSSIIKAIREYFWNNDFIEVDTPILRGYEDPTDNPIFTTMGPRGWPRLHLRTCHEEFVRRTLSLHPKVFEIGKAFRNEDIISDIHLPEFQLLEHYEKSSEPTIAINRIQELIKNISSVLLEDYDNAECLDYSLLLIFTPPPFSFLRSYHA